MNGVKQIQMYIEHGRGIEEAGTARGMISPMNGFTNGLECLPLIFIMVSNQIIIRLQSQNFIRTPNRQC
jgi:hypothetical protein